MEPTQNQRHLDWRSLRRLRAAYLEDGPVEADYWTAEDDLAAYDLTFAQRIAWKWDEALAALAREGWRPPGGRVLDWGCGTGVAARRFFAAFPGLPSPRVQFFDRSPMAVRFARRRFAAAHPGLPDGLLDEPDVLLASHVLGELNGTGEAELERAIRRSRAVIWVEPGSRAVATRLAAFRDRLLDVFTPVAPCTHAAPCPMRAPGNERHWCHFFAHAPAEVHSDPDWAAFADELGIDVRTVPYSYLVLSRNPPAADGAKSRIIGRPRLYKGLAKVLACDASGLTEHPLLQRTHRDLYRAFRKGRFDTLLDSVARESPEERPTRCD